MPSKRSVSVDPGVVDFRVEPEYWFSDCPHTPVSPAAPGSTFDFERVMPRISDVAFLNPRLPASLFQKWPTSLPPAAWMTSR
ncbi:hypothetical protein B0T42_10160 [Rathayibacter sp. VKM Ac-2630]|nr:hypothetical protein B0T42_10160 [Rathayibacter sp. VKM Ac-2630]